MTDTIQQLEKPERKAVATQEVIALAEKHGGTITPEIILAEAKRKRSPLHGFFCWDDTEAAAEYRRIQAQQLIRRIKVTITGGDERHIRVRAFVNVIEPQPEGEEPEEEIDGHGINCRPRGIYGRLPHPDDPTSQARRGVIPRQIQRAQRGRAHPRRDGQLRRQIYHAMTSNATRQAWLGMARRGAARHRRQGGARLGKARPGIAGGAGPGTAQTATGERGKNGRIHNQQTHTQ
jgi:hypothetical protein